MKGAESAEVCAALFKLHVATNHVDDVNAVKQILDEALWNHSTTNAARLVC